MQYGESNNNNVAIVAIIVISILISGGVVLYLNENFSGRDVMHGGTTTIIERTQYVEQTEEKSSGFTFKHESEDDTVTEAGTPRMFL